MNYLALFFLLTHVYGNQTIDSISKGVIAKEHQFPFFAQLRISKVERINENFNETTESSYSASLIHPSWILTCGRCFSHISSNPTVKVYVGTNLRYGKNASVNAIKRTFVHPGYTEEKDSRGAVIAIKNDIALALLETPYTVTKSSVGILFLPPRAQVKRSLTSRCRRGIIMGIGMVDPDIDRYNEHLQYNTVYSKPKHNLGHPKPPDPPLDTVFYTEIEWLEGHPWKGDCGEPFVCYYTDTPVIYGVLSAVKSRMTYRGAIIDTYEAIDKYVDFILSIVKQAKVYRGKVQWYIDKPIIIETRSSVIRISSSVICIYLSTILNLLQNVRLFD